LEGFLTFISSSGGSFANLTISNLVILDFDVAIGMFFGGGSTTAFSGTSVTNNRIRIPSDERGTSSLPAGEPFQNIGIHFSFGTNQDFSNNLFEVPGNGLSDRSGPDSANHQSAATVVMQSNVSGGSVYDGLTIEDNEIRILNAQSPDPELVYGIWENGHAHSANITIRNNRFLNLAAGNDPALNLQRAFRLTSHSSATTEVRYENNRIEGANLGFKWLEGFGGQDFSAHDPIVLDGNTLLNNDTAVAIRSQEKA